MTIVYSNDKTISVFNKDKDGDFHHQRCTYESFHEIIDVINNLSKKPSASNSDSLANLCTLTSIMARQINNLIWQLKVLNTQSKQQNLSCLDEELVFLYSKLDELQDDLQIIIDRQTKSKIKTIEDNIKLNLGSGDLPLEGWINIDATSPDLAYNVLWGLPFEDNSIQFVYSAYLLEHIRYKEEAFNLLKEIKRVLKPRGVVRLCVPNIKPYLSAYIKEDHTFFKNVESKWGFSFGATNLEKVLNYAGINHTLGVIDGHKFGYDVETFEKLLQEVQFSKFYASSFMKSLYKELMIDPNKLTAETYQGESLSLIYEAIK